MMASIQFIFIQVICAMVLSQMISAEEPSKRLLLDDDMTLDLGAEINKLRTQFLDFQSQMNSKLVEVQKENEMLKQRLISSQDFQTKQEAKMNATNAKLVEVQKKYEQLGQTLVTLQGEGQVYVRWGRNVCPSTANFVYTGFMAGKHYDDKGSGTNHLCLPRDPTWLNYTDGVNILAKSFVYGTEIDTDDNQHIFGYPVNEQDMPCAVCQSKHRTTMMIPARGSCYGGWTQEYRGYLMSSYYTHYAYEYVCVDENPEFLNHGSTSDDQHIVYLTEARCGSLPCPPYVDARELACVVCSK